MTKLSQMTPFRLLRFFGFVVAMSCSCSKPGLDSGHSAASAPQPQPTPKIEPKPTVTSKSNETKPKIVDFRTGTEWRIVNDGVMGGLSESTFGVEEGRGVFRGNLSPENGGGFASVRAEVRLPPGLDMVAVAVRVLGDGKHYQLRIRTDDQWDGPAYKHEFPTMKGEWVNVTLPLSDFELSFRGRPVPDAPPIDPDRIRQVGLLIAGKQWGSFRLEVESIRAITKQAQSAP